MASVKDVFIPYKRIELNSTGDFSGIWHLFEFIPLPPPAELSDVISDIINKEEVQVDEYLRVRHSFSCKKKKHSLTKEIKNTLSSISEVKYRVLIKEDYIDKTTKLPALEGQPIAIVIDPEINFNSYPHHPHLNMPLIDELPASICYTADYKSLGNDENTRIINSISEISIWLVRHQIWEKYFEIYQEKLWIGIESKHEYNEDKKYVFRNPFGKCWCGNNEKYFMCCLTKDIKSANNLKANIDLIKTCRKLSDLWKRYIEIDKSIKKKFIPIFDEFFR